MTLTPAIDFVERKYDAAINTLKEARDRIDRVIDNAFRDFLGVKSEAENARDVDGKVSLFLNESHVSFREKVFHAFFGERPEANACFAGALRSALKGQCEAAGIDCPDIRAFNTDYNFGENHSTSVVALPMKAEDAARIVSAMWPERGRRMLETLRREHGGDLSGVDFPFAFRMRAEKDGENTKVSFSACMDGRTLESVREQIFPGWPAKELCDRCLGVACGANANLGHEGMRSIAIAGTGNLDVWRLRSVVKMMMTTGTLGKAIETAAAAMTGAALGSSILPVAAVAGGVISGYRLWKMAKKFHKTFKKEIGRLRTAGMLRDAAPEGSMDRIAASLGEDGIGAVRNAIDSPLRTLFPKLAGLMEAASDAAESVKLSVRATFNAFGMLVREVRSEEIIDGIVDQGIRLSEEPRPGERTRQRQRGPRA